MKSGSTVKSSCKKGPKPKWRRGGLRCQAVPKETDASGPKRPPKVGPARAKGVKEVESAEVTYRKDKDVPKGEDVAKKKRRMPKRWKRSAAASKKGNSGSGATVERWTHRSPNKQRSRFTCDVVEWLRPKTAAGKHLESPHHDISAKDLLYQLI